MIPYAPYFSSLRGPVHIQAQLWRSVDDRRRGRGDQMSDQKKLSDVQYARLAPLLPPPSNHLKISHRQVLDARLYVLSQGCTWRMSSATGTRSMCG